MPIQVLMPALSPTMTEGTLSKWLKAPGDKIEPGQVIAEIETDKATMEVEAVDEGVIGKIFIPEGTENVKVNTLIALILEEGEDESALEGIQATTVETTNTTPTSESVVKADQTSSSNIPTGTTQTTENRTDTRVFASPLARRIATNAQLSLEGIEGSGPHGRIVKKDVELALNAPRPASKLQALVDSSTPSTYTDVTLNGMRKTIAKRLLESKQTIPHFYLSVDCNLDALLSLRSQINEKLVDEKISVNDFVVKAVAQSLIKVPEANVSWLDGGKLRQYHGADVSIAVAIDGGLITPVVLSAHAKSLRAISTACKDLASRARLGKLLPEEYQGGSFTISNLGMYGIKNFQAIVNPPQACILAVGAGEKRAVVVGDSVKISTVMSVTLSVDHRAVDGAVGADFLKAFKDFIENPLQLLL